jgi:hypothetical protein
MATFERLLAAIVEDDRERVGTLLEAEPELVGQSVVNPKLYESGIFHWLYRGDTALHLAAAGYRVEIVESLLQTGADANAFTNHRHSGPLHYAADGYVSGDAWDPERQVETIKCLFEAGAIIDARDKNAATPLHRAVRTRCAAAVQYLLANGAPPESRNNSGSTPFHLAVQNTGRGGSGDEVAKNAQREIIEAFLNAGVNPQLKDGKGKSVVDWVKSEPILQMFANQPAPKPS